MADTEIASPLRPAKRQFEGLGNLHFETIVMDVMKGHRPLGIYRSIRFPRTDFESKMTNRRSVILGVAATIATVSSPAFAHKSPKPFVLDPLYVPQYVLFPRLYVAGTIVIDTTNRFLYLVGGTGFARRYGIGVGRAGLAWTGVADVGRKAKWPRWTPTANMIRRNPRRYARYADGVRGGPKNPLGARALYLYRHGRDTYYRIHGTNEPWTIGRAVSNGCIRMINEHVEDLYERVPIGTIVVVLRGAGVVS